MGESLDIDQLRAAARQGRLEWQRHALERMVERGITRAEVLEVLRGGECIEDYPGDRPLPSGLFLSWVRGRPLHVVAAFDVSPSPLFSLQPAAHHPPPVRRAGRLAAHAGEAAAAALGALQVAGSGRQGGRSRRWKSPFDFLYAVWEAITGTGRTASAQPRPNEGPSRPSVVL